MARKVVGLDIGTTAVRAAEVSVRRGQVVLERIGQAGLPGGAVVDGEVKDPAAVATALPPFRKPRKRGRQCPSIASPPASAPVSSPTRIVPTRAGTNPFAMSSRTTGIPYQRP